VKVTEHGTTGNIKNGVSTYHSWVPLLPDKVTWPQTNSKNLPNANNSIFIKYNTNISATIDQVMTCEFFVHSKYVIYAADCVWNVMAHMQKPDFAFQRKGRVHLNQQGCQFSRLLAAEVCASVVVMLDTPCSKVVWSVLATHSIRQFPLHFPSCASPCAITFQLDSTAFYCTLHT